MANKPVCKKSWIKESFLDARPGDVLFSDGGDMCVRLDGYAIIPIEDYHELRGVKGFVENSWPCAKCGATGPTSEGHDPCLANLPGVIHACCGHGVDEGYLMLENGVIIRGRFDRPSLSPAKDGEDARDD